MKYYAIKFEHTGPARHGIPTKVHEILLPNIAEPGYYRAAISLEAFKIRSQPNKTPWYWVQSEIEFLHNVNSIPNFIDNPYERCELVFHSSLWDFYKTIGYELPNRKKRDKIKI